MASCKRNGLWEVALQLMEQAKATSQLPDVISFNCLIGTCHLAGRWDLSLHFLSAMQPSALTPDRSSYTEAAGACEKSSQWQHALEVLSSALSQQLVPDGTCAGAVAGALRSAKGEDTALGLLQQLRKRWNPQSAEPENFGGGIPVLVKRRGVLVVSKPEGLSTEDMLERLFGNRWPTVVQTVSRLDYPTSGVLPIALGPEGSAECSWLQAQFAAKLVKKEYLCLALGPFLGEVGDEGAITKPLRTVGVGSLRTEVSPSGRYARTGYRILRRFEGAESLLEPKLLLAMPETGRTHQIRVHLASMDQPLVGDQTFRDKTCAWFECDRCLTAEEVAETEKAGQASPDAMPQEVQRQVDQIVRQRLGQVFGSVFGKVMQATEAANAGEAQAAVVRQDGLTKMLKVDAWKPATREEELKTWREWQFQLLTWLSAHDAKFSEDLAAITEIPEDHALMNETKVQRSQQLYGVLVSLLRGRPLLLVKGLEKFRGDKGAEV
eukprot:s1337_g15.t1